MLSVLFTVGTSHVANPQLVKTTHLKQDFKCYDIKVFFSRKNSYCFPSLLRYGLSKGEIEKALPEIDTSATFIREVCPPYMAHVECKAGKYRRHDGLCNNVKHPTWGATNTPFQR